MPATLTLMQAYIYNRSKLRGIKPLVIQLFQTIKKAPKDQSGALLFLLWISAIDFCYETVDYKVIGYNVIEKDEPQPQVESAFGLLTTKRAPSKPSR